MPATSRYEHDPRVTAYDIGNGGTGYTVVADDGSTFEVLPTVPFHWVICEGPNLDFVQVAGGEFAIGIATADAAIGAVIGDPQEATRA